MRLAVTGGTGFVGGHLLAAAVAQGHSVRALARRPQRTMPGVTWIAGDLAAPGDLCAGADAVIHIAGTINARSRADYDAGNVAGTAGIVAAARAAGVNRFVHVSSLAAREPGLADYGASKAAAEDVVRSSVADAAIVRPPGVYGPGDRETLAFFRLVARGIAVLPGSGRFSLIEVGDLAAALLAVATSDWRGTAEVDDGGAAAIPMPNWPEQIGTALGRRPRLFRPSPRLLRAAARVDTAVACLHAAGCRRSATGRVATFAHPDWVAAAGRALPARPVAAGGRSHRPVWRGPWHGPRHRCENGADDLALLSVRPDFDHSLLPCVAPAVRNLRMTRDAIFVRICELIAPLNRKSVALGEATTFSGDLEMDSLTVMDLVANIEDEWDIVLPLNMLPELETVGQVADAVAKLAK